MARATNPRSNSRNISDHGCVIFPPGPNEENPGFSLAPGFLNGETTASLGAAQPPPDLAHGVEEIPDALSSVQSRSELLPRHQPLEARMAPERGEDRVVEALAVSGLGAIRGPIRSVRLQSLPRAPQPAPHSIELSASLTASARALSGSWKT